MRTRKLNKNLIAGLAAALLLLLTAGALSHWTIRRSIENDRWLARTHAAMAMQRELLARLTEAETAMFGYVITGQADFLSPYREATNRVRVLISELEAAHRNDEGQSKRLAEVRQLSERRLALIEHRIEVRTRDGFAPAAELIQRREAKGVMDALRGLLAAMSRRQEELLAERERAAVSGARRTILFGVISSVGSVGVLSVVFAFLFRENQRRRRSEEMLREARDILEVRVRERTAELGHTNARLQAEVAEHERAETALRESERKLIEMSDALAEKNKDLEMIVYIASHDLRSPLVNIQGYARELSMACQELDAALQQNGAAGANAEIVRRILREDVPEAVRFINAGALRVDTLLAGFLRFSRLGHQAIEPRALHVRQLLDGIAKAMEYQLQDAGASLHLGDLPACRGDETQIGQVFSNLLDNALKYRDPARPLLIRVDGRIENGRAIYAIRDTGMGIAPEQQKKVFEIFCRLNPNGVAGEGLGLSIAKKIIERHGGKIRLESEAGQGSTFFIDLPTGAEVSKDDRIDQ